jgi:thiamine monophosphate kinase
VRLSDLGELGLLQELESRGLVQRIENDAAELDGGLVVTQDALVESVHFRLDWISWRDLGFRAAAVNLSDLAASGAEPRGLIVSLGAPASSRVEDLLELYDGISEARVPVVGGDTTRADSLVLSVTALGRSEFPDARGRTRATGSWSRARSAEQAPPSAKAATFGRRYGSRRAVASLPRPRPCSICPMGWHRTLGTSPRARACVA